MYFIKTIFPLRDLFFTVLHSAHDFFRYADMTYINKLGFSEETLENDVIDALVSRELEMPEWSDFEAGISNFAQELIPPLPESDQTLDFLGMKVRTEVPSEKLIEIDGLMQNCTEIVMSMNYIDFMFVFASILHERTVIFVSEERRVIGQAIQFFSSMIQPLNWPYPVIYSMPENCLEILASPVPLIAGLLAPGKKIMNQIVPEYAAISRDIVYVLLDDRFILAGKSTVNKTYMPRFDRSIKELHENIKHAFVSTSSSSINYNSKSREFSKKSSSKLPKKTPMSPNKKKIDGNNQVLLKNYLHGLRSAIERSCKVSDPEDTNKCESEIRQRLGHKDQKFLDAFLQTQTFAFSLPQLKLDISK